VWLHTLARMSAVVIRPMTEGDLGATERTSAMTFLDADRRDCRVSEPVPAPRSWAARLDIGQEGYLAVRGMRDPRPYLASGHFL
jgi:hypothetical protein